MVYSSDSEHSDMPVVAENDVYKAKDDQLVPLAQAELNNLIRDVKPWKASAWFSSQSETSVGTKNNVLLISRLWEIIKTVFHIPGQVFIGLLQQLSWIV